MLPRKISVRRRSRPARLPDHTRPHGRRRGYLYSRVESPPCDRIARRPTGGFVFVTAAVFLFLALVVLGAMNPNTGPLTKHEPVSTARIR
jgi:hypothetical protein